MEEKLKKLCDLGREITALIKELGEDGAFGNAENDIYVQAVISGINCYYNESVIPRELQDFKRTIDNSLEEQSKKNLKFYKDREKAVTKMGDELHHKGNTCLRFLSNHDDIKVKKSFITMLEQEKANIIKRQNQNNQQTPAGTKPKFTPAVIEGGN